MTDIYHCLMQSVKFSLIKRFNWRQAVKQSHSITQKLPNFQKQRHSWLLSLPWWSIQSERQAWIYIGIFAIHWVNVPFITSTENFWGWICTLQVKINWFIYKLKCNQLLIFYYLYFLLFFFWLASKLELTITTIHKVPII